MLCTQPQPVDVIGQLCFVGVGGSGKQVSGQVYFPQRPQRIDYQNIRVQIQDPLNEILKHKDLDKSTVKELVDACKISRQSFYYHFQVIMDVVEWYQNQALKQSIEQSLAAPMYKEAIRGVICETFQHKELTLQLVASQRRKEMEALFIKAVRTYLQELFRGKGAEVSCSPADIDTVLSFYSCGLVGIMLNDLKQKNPDVDALAEQMCRVLTGKISLWFVEQE